MARSKFVPTTQIHKPLLAKKGKKLVAAPEEGGVKKAKHSRRYKPGTVTVRGIRKAQRHGNRGIPKSVINSLVREIASNFSADNTEMRFKKTALRTLHEAAEGFQTDLFSRFTPSARRSTRSR
jgi:histone H3